VLYSLEEIRSGLGALLLRGVSEGVRCFAPSGSLGEGQVRYSLGESRRGLGALIPRGVSQGVRRFTPSGSLRGD